MRVLTVIAITALTTAILVVCSVSFFYLETEYEGDQLLAVNFNEYQVYATDSLSDGPYLFWKDSATALIYQLCAGKVEKVEISAADTIRFASLCSESSRAYLIAVARPDIDPQEFEGAGKIFAVSDIHGEYDYLVSLLQNSGVIDDSCRWSWGDGHLVINGDVFDRGRKVTECLWLIYNLEKEAALAGGQVHYILGNHELMVLRGDLRYVHWKYLDKTAGLMRISYDDLFGPKSEMGRWLRSKNVMVKLDSILFVHGGISPEILDRELTMTDYNEYVRAHLDERTYAYRLDSLQKFMFGSFSPFWYRALVKDYKHRRATVEQVDSILEYFNVSSIVVGHTEVDEVTALYDGRVFAIDVPAEELLSLQGLLWEDERFFRVLGSGEKEALDQ